MSGLPPSVQAWRDAGRTADAGGRKIFLTSAGTGPHTVFVLHGFPGSSFDWSGVVPLIAPHARVVAFDFAGYGLSEKPTDRVTLFDQADIAEAIADVAGIERCVLVSHDMGDTVAAELLSRSTAGTLRFDIERSMLTNGSIFMDLVQLSPGQLALLSLPDEPLATSIPMEGFKPGIAATFPADHPPSDDELDAMLALIAHDGGDRMLPRLIRYIEERRVNQEHWTAGLVDFKGPMTAIWGEQDPIAVLPMAHKLAALRPGTEVITWPDVGHWPSIEAPERLAAAIVERLGS